jgi:hypothetical protein
MPEGANSVPEVSPEGGYGHWTYGVRKGAEFLREQRPGQHQKAYVPKLKIFRKTTGDWPVAIAGFLGLRDSGRPQVQLTALFHPILEDPRQVLHA